MNTLEINKVLSRNPVTSSCYLGCFASDQIPMGTTIYPYCMVVNVEPSLFKGSHWVSMYCGRADQIEYYDSLGAWPPISPHICDYLSKFSEIRFNNISLQSAFARSCGRHAIFFLYNRCKGVPFETIVKFLRSYTSPDRIVNDFIKKIIFNKQV